MISSTIYGRLENDQIIELDDPDELAYIIKKVNENVHPIN